jgi:hypothetical protein
MQLRRAILLFGLVNAALFSALLPLWEGFDEAFHYGYVEALWQTGRLPVLGRALLPNDVSLSFRAAPMSYIVCRSIPDATSYDVWLALPQVEKERRRQRLDLLRPEHIESAAPNYEAHHPPLAYLLLAPLDWAISKASITMRVLVLRLFGAVCCMVLLYFGMSALCRTLDVPEPFANAALFAIFCSEMLYATIAHVANDWLAVGISAMFFAALASFIKEPSRRSATGVGAWLAAALLTKAYFLAFALLTTASAALIVWRRRAGMKMLFPGIMLALVLAGPWYTRNMVLYGNISGTQEEFDGIGFSQTLAAAPRIDWIATAGYLARGSIWTGNNSFTSFSRGTLGFALGLLFTGLGAWLYRRRLIQTGERVMFAGIVLFSAAIAYASCASFADRNGNVAGASPWYTQVLLTPVMALAFLGLSRWRRAGPVLAACTAMVWAWILIATWTVKLFPMYSGAGAAPRRIRDLWNWYAHQAAAHTDDFSLLALAPVPLLYVGLVVSVALCVLTGAAVIRNLGTGE